MHERHVDLGAGRTMVERLGSRVRLPQYKDDVGTIDEANEPTIDTYIDTAIQERRFRSEMELAAALAVSRSTVSHWRQRKAWPSEAVMMRLADYAGIDQDEALLHLSLWRCRQPAIKKLYLHMLSAIYGLKKYVFIFAITGVATSGVLGTAQGTKAEQINSIGSALYIIR